MEVVRGHTHALDHDAVAAVLVDQAVLAPVAQDTSVRRRDGIAEHAKVVVLGPADGGAVSQAKPMGGILELINKGWHERNGPRRVCKFRLSGSWRT